MLRKLRKAKGISMKELGLKIGVAESTISQYETGKREPDFETLLKLSEFFDVSTDYLLRGDIYNGQIKRPVQTDELTFDDFTYALHNETKELTDENKEKLLEMARLFKLSQEHDEGK